MCRLERLGFKLEPTYAEVPKGLFIGWFWYLGKKRMFHKDSWIAELMNMEEEPCK